MSKRSLSPAEWSLLRALILEARDPTGYPPAEPIAAGLGMSNDEARDHLDMLEHFEMVRLLKCGEPVPHFEVLWRGREEAAQRGESVPSPVADAGKLLAFLRNPGDGLPAGSQQADDEAIVRRFGWSHRQALDAARVLAHRDHVKLQTTMSESFVVLLTARGRRST